MELINGVQLLNITFLSASFAGWAAAALLATLIVPLKQVYMHGYTHTSLTLTFIKFYLSFILTQFFVLHLDCSYGVLSTK